MRPSPEWIPIRWPSGPLEAKLREGKSNAALWLSWHRPEALDVLRNSPFNCLVVSWAANRPEDAEQQRTLAPLMEAARRRGLHVVGWIGEGVDESRADQAARAAGCQGVVRDEVKGSWPGVAAGHGADTASAGPTGAPWIDSNGWVARLAEARQPGTRPWLWFDPPEEQVLRPESFLVATADAQAFGGRWVTSLTAPLHAALVERKTEAVAIWERLGRATSFFEMHADWRQMRTRALLGVVSDFAGRNQAQAEEVLNLSTRRGLHYRILLKHQAGAAGFAGLKANLYIDEQPPEPALAAALLEFARAGGMLIVGRSAAGFVPAMATEPLPNRRYDIGALGRGRVAVSHNAADFEDPFLIACDAQLLLSYRNDPIRFWNYGSIGWHYTSSADRSRSLLHLVNFSGRPGSDDMGLIVREPYRTARLWRIEDPAPVDLKPRPSRVGIELPLPPVPVYAAVELGR